MAVSPVDGPAISPTCLSVCLWHSAGSLSAAARRCIKSEQEKHASERSVNSCDGYVSAGASNQHVVRCVVDNATAAAAAAASCITVGDMDDFAVHLALATHR